ncbi:Uncharacterised protein [Citrobacter werkmanii]|uniref:Uncharacterized protein n=1 Tax=Citrobacter werkmanii TaxID=67827 RepID=A0A9N8CNV1_9ENTR|nr:hypothetical protein [Citrobacter werkmanii]CAB5537395.1 Uncharacterised protein [Citrobacter werkmanii]CAB5546132.1 Uncharacterised protein [Citrobacter werkmanii]CAB5572899.1 Uncharacterised protein [Citrobacter werkmanii]CAB5574346.1 Uncharacterised protein [Citrobacter werkmanii]CAB5576692.1 Uncharacterised protein [Citrobacter werkmanii]
MLKIIMAFFRRRSWEDSKEFDYRKQFWGHALQGLSNFNQKRKFSITGHCCNVGVLFAPVPNRGDKLLIKFTNGKVGILRIHKIEFFRNPSDMFAATVKFEGLKSDEVV